MLTHWILKTSSIDLQNGLWKNSHRMANKEYSFQAWVWQLGFGLKPMMQYSAMHHLCRNLAQGWGVRCSSGKCIPLLGRHHETPTHSSTKFAKPYPYWHKVWAQIHNLTLPYVALKLTKMVPLPSWHWSILTKLQFTSSPCPVLNSNHLLGKCSVSQWNVLVV